MMVWGAFIASTKCNLVLLCFDKHKVVDFVDIMYELALEPYDYYHGNYKHFILIVDGVPI